MTAALSSPDEETAFARLPGQLRRGDECELAWEAGTLSIPVPGVGALLVATPQPDDDLLAAAESAGVQIALFANVQGYEARRRAMLDIAFDSVVTMDERGVVVAVNRAAEKTFGYRAAEMVGRTVAELIIPEALREAHREGLERYLRTGRGPVVGRRVELTAMRADGSEFPVEVVVTRPDVPGERVFYGYVRDLTARYVAEAALHRLADEQAALRRVATAVAAETDPSHAFAVVTEEVARLLSAQAANLVRFGDDMTATAVGAWNDPSARLMPLGMTMPMDGDTATARVYRTGAPARVDNYAGFDGILAEAMRSAGFHSAVAAPVFLDGRLWGAMIVAQRPPEAVPGGRRAARRGLRRARRAGAGQRAVARGSRRLARAHRRGRRRRAPAARAQPARRRAAAARLARADAAAGGPPPPGRRRPRPRRPRSSRTRSRSCASWPAASTRRSSPSAASSRRPRARRPRPGAGRAGGRARATAPERRSRPPRTSSSPRR